MTPRTRRWQEESIEDPSSKFELITETIPVETHRATTPEKARIPTAYLSSTLFHCMSKSNGEQ